MKRIIDKLGIVEKVLSFTEFKENKECKKTDGSKKNKVNVPKLDDANWAGGKKSDECILILTEGDSAKSMAVSGLSVVGRDKYGVFPLKGKVMNIKGMSHRQIFDNTEITNMKKIIGLETDKIYKDTRSLRYGKIMVMTDQDHDGSHIKALLLNVFHTLWPSLLDLGYITSMITPIVKVSKGKLSKSFYNLTEYKEWLSKMGDHHKWKSKYYKGLGTSNAQEAREYFSNLKMNNYITTEQTDASIELAFRKTKADERKKWLYGYNEDNILNPDTTEIHIEDFIHKELIHFSNSDTLRSIGSVYDGLKPSQRKILYSCFKRKLYSEIRVAQLSGYVSENAAYHHGEMSLQGAIIGMAQRFVGSNNINLLQPNGQFGTRIMGGNDAASSRYIHTELNKITNLLYPSSDFPILTYNEDDGIMVEPKYYVPILPMVLVNGLMGIGTGFSSTIPQYNPLDIIENIKRKLKGESYKDIVPWYRTFKGKIIKIENQSYMSKGVYEIIDDRTIKITELPIGIWTDNYKQFLDGLVISKKDDKKSKKECIIDYINNSDDSNVDFTLTLPPNFIKSKQWSEDNYIDAIEKVFKLHSNKGLSVSNMHLYNHEGRIVKYETTNDIIDDFYTIRYSLYEDRKKYLLDKLRKQLLHLDSKIRFLKDITDETLEIMKKSKQDIMDELYKRGYLIISKDKMIESTSEGYKKMKVGGDIYDYILKLPIYSLTKEEMEKVMNEYTKVELDYQELDKTSISEMWISELNTFCKEYKKMK